MPLYDNNGTTSFLLKEIYDHDGTTAHKLKEVYDNDGTTNRLLYKSELDFNVAGAVTVTNSAGAATATTTSGNNRVVKVQGSYPDIGGYINFRYNTATDCGSYSKMTVVFDTDDNIGNVYIGVGTNFATGYIETNSMQGYTNFAAKATAGHVTGGGTNRSVTVNLGSVNVNNYVMISAMAQYYQSTNPTGTLTIKSILFS